MSDRLEVVADQETLGCSESTRAAAEPAWGSAARCDGFWLVPKIFPWLAKAEACLDDAEKKQHPSGLRLQLVSPARQPVARELPFGASGDVEIFICVHGRRDQCCARLGNKVFRGADGDSAVHRTTHLGGHRFAPTLTVAPHGYCYAWIDESDIEPLLKAHRQGELFDLSRVRGNHRLGSAEQVAELSLRAEIGELRILELPSFSDVEVSDSAWRGTIRLGDRMAKVALEKEEGASRLKACGGETSAWRVWRPSSVKLC